MPSDPLTHGRKTVAGLDLTFGATTQAPCGKRRPAGRTSADPDKVTCPDCRAWAAAEERELAQTALAAAGLAGKYPGLSPYSPEDFEETAAGHEARAGRWDGTP